MKTLKSQQGGKLFSLLPFFRSQPQRLFLFRLRKSRRTFYAQIEYLCFHTASVEGGHQVAATALTIEGS